MGIFDKDHSREELNIIEHLIQENRELTQLLYRLIPIPGNKHLKLAFNFFNNNKNCNFMSVVSSLNLVSAAPITLTMSVVDQSGSVIAGVLSGLSYAPADATQDIAVVDPSDPLEVDVHAVSSTGGTSVVATGNFVSTLLGTDGVTPVFSGPVTGTLTLTNNIPAVTLTPSLAFNQ